MQAVDNMNNLNEELKKETVHHKQTLDKKLSQEQELKDRMVELNTKSEKCVELEKEVSYLRS